MSEKILAVAAGHEITEEELNTLIRNYPAEQQMYLSDPRAREQVLEQLIAFHLFAKLAEEENIMESQEYKTMIEKMKVELASHMAATKVIEGIRVTEEEEAAFYEENKSRLGRSERVSAKHILVDTLELAEKAAKEISQGKSFEDAAKEYSTCPTKDKGGDLGFFSRGQMVPEFEKAAFEGALHQVIGPVKTQFGYHLIWVEEKQEGSIPEFAQVKEQIHQQLIQEKQQEAYGAKVAELTEKYGVEKK